MLKNIAESVSSLSKIIASVLQLAVLAAIIGGGWWAYTTVTGFMSKPIKLPAVDASGVKLPEIKLPEVKLPEVKLPEVKLPELPSFKEKPKQYDKDGVQMWDFIPEQPSKPAPKTAKPDDSDIQA